MTSTKKTKLQTRPLASVFHPALFTSILGQMAIHLGCMIYIVSLAKEAMGEDELDAIKKFEDERNKKIGGMSDEELEDIWWFLKVRGV